jgi:predicted nucleotidyltransferase
MKTEESAEKKGIHALPEAVRERLMEWARALEKALGDDLVGILVHGSTVRGEYRPGDSDVDAVVVLKDASYEKLESIGNAMQLARYAARIEAMILTEEEIKGAADCFPLLYDEIKQRSAVIAGRDPFASVEVLDTHRRLRIEQELREAQIRLRRAVTDAGGQKEAVGGAVARKTRQIRGPLHALLALKHIEAKQDLPSVLAKAGETWSVDIAALRAPREKPDAAHAALVKLLDAAIADVDKLAGGSAEGGPTDR